MDFINVLPEHPLNEFPVAKCTNEALLLFENVQVDESFLYNFSGAKGPILRDEDLKRIDYPIDELAEQFEILTVKRVNRTDEGYVYYFMGTPWPNSKGNRRACLNAQFTIRFTKSLVCWNEFSGDAWFVNGPENTKK